MIPMWGLDVQPTLPCVHSQCPHSGPSLSNCQRLYLSSISLSKGLCHAAPSLEKPFTSSQDQNPFLLQDPAPTSFLWTNLKIPLTGTFFPSLISIEFFSSSLPLSFVFKARFLSIMTTY